MTYYSVDSLNDEILKDYDYVVKLGNQEREEEYFTQWIELIPIILTSSDNKFIQTIYQRLDDYVMRKEPETTDRAPVYDGYYYEGISRINENLCQIKLKPISVNNTNSILTRLIHSSAGIPELSYRYLWRNILVQLYYNRDEWIMEYWKVASSKYDYMKYLGKPEIFRVETHQTDSENYRKYWEKQREDFLEFHIMLCAMLIQQRKYDLLNLMLFYTTSEPPSYPLVPSKMGDILEIFHKINKNISTNPFDYENKYRMPNMHGITEGKIAGAVNLYLSLLAYRVYTIRWDYGLSMSIALSTYLPDTLADLKRQKKYLDNFKYWLKKAQNNKELIQTVLQVNLDEEIERKSRQFNGVEIPHSDEIVDKTEKEIEEKMEMLRENQPLDREMIEEELKNLRESVMNAMQPYKVFLKERGDNQDIHYKGKSRHLGSFISIPYPNTAFLRNSDMSYVDMANTVSSNILHNYRHFFASAFYLEHPDTNYSISSEQLLDAIDKLELNANHCIISFNVYWEYYMHSRPELQLQKKDDNEYVYDKDIRILSLPCPTDLFSQMIYV
ncbi:MAG: hypothetical protein Q4A64_07845, partial [Porphyromonadaceae bacterium]|nr:hypothetical protein [Porphyromonadaceae bacterium]